MCIVYCKYQNSVCCESFNLIYGIWGQIQEEIFFCIASTFNGNIRKLSYSQRLKMYICVLSWMLSNFYTSLE